MPAFTAMWEACTPIIVISSAVDWYLKSSLAKFWAVDIFSSSEDGFLTFFQLNQAFH